MPNKKAKEASRADSGSTSTKSDGAMQGAASLQADEKVTIPPAASRPDSYTALTPNDAATNGLDSLLSTLNNVTPPVVVRLPNVSDDRALGFDVTRSAQGDAVIVQNLEPTYHDDLGPQMNSSETLRNGDSIVSVHISLASLKFEESVRLLNALLPFNPEFQVKTEPDWMAKMQSINELTAHIGPQQRGSDLTPQESFGASSANWNQDFGENV